MIDAIRRTLKTCTVEALSVRQRLAWKIGYASLFAMIASVFEAFVHYAEDYSRGNEKEARTPTGYLQEPKLLVLDEPTNGLDVVSTHLSRTRKKLAECVENLEKSIPH